MSNPLDQIQNPLNTSSKLEVQIDMKYWQSVKKKLKYASLKNEPLPELQNLFHLLVNLNTLSNLDQYLGLYVPKAWLFDIFLEIVRGIMQSKTIYSNKMEDLLQNCLQQMILLWLKTLSEGNPGLFKIAEVVLNPIQPYYMHRPIQDFLEKISLKSTQIFDLIYQTVSSQNPLPSTMVIISVCWMVNNLSSLLPQDSALEYTTNFRKVLCETIIDNNQNYKDKFDVMFIKRSYEAFERLFEISFGCAEEGLYAFLSFRLQLARLCLEDWNKEAHKRIGIRIIENIMTDVENLSADNFEDRGRILCNEFFRDIFDGKYERVSLSQLILNTQPDVFHYAMKQNLLKAEDFKILWIALKHTQKTIYSVIQKLFKPEHAPILLDNIISSNFPNILNDIDPADIELFSKIVFICKPQETIVRKMKNLFWDILGNSDKQVTSKLFKCIFNKYYCMMCSDSPRWKRTANILNKCIPHIEDDITKFTYFRIITLMPFYYKTENITLREKKVLEMFIQHLKSFKLLNKPQLNHKPEPSYLPEVLQRLDCLEGLINRIRLWPEKCDLTYEVLSELWEIFVEKAFISTERDLFFEILKRLVKSYLVLGMPPDELMKFYKQKILQQDTLELLKKSKEGASCFRIYVIAVNHDLKKIWRVRPVPRENVKAGFLVKVVPEELEAYEEIWNFIMLCEDRKAISKNIKFLVKIYFHLEDQFETDLTNIRERFITRCFKYLKSPVPGSSNCYLKCLELINKMMDETGKNGIEELDSHAKMISNKLHELSLDLTDFGQPITKFSISSNSTVIQLLKENAKKLGVDWETIEVLRYPYSPQKISNSENGKTLPEIGFRRQECLKVLKRAALPRIDLFCDSDTLHPRAKKIFSKCFEEYSDNGKMSIEQCAIFLDPQYRYFQWDITNNGGVMKIFKNYDSDRDGYLTLDDFFKYQADYCKQGNQRMWDTVQRYNKRHDLRDESDLARINTDKRSLVSSLIQSNCRYYEILFSLLDREEELASGAWKLLNRLPTYAQLFEDIIMLRGVRGIEDPTKRDWTSLLGLKSKYKLLYVLNIVEHLMYYDENSKKIALAEDPKLMEYQTTWKQDFIRYGGLDYLSSVFGMFKPNEFTVLTQIYKRVLESAKAIDSKLREDGQSEKEIQGRIMSFLEVSSQFESEYRTIEQTVAANLMRRTIRKLKSRRAKI